LLLFNDRAAASTADIVAALGAEEPLVHRTLASLSQARLRLLRVPYRWLFPSIVMFCALGNYSVTVTVTRDATVSLNGLNNNTGTGLYRVVRVDVSVTGPNSTSITLSGYRTNYNCEAVTDPGCKGLN